MEEFQEFQLFQESNYFEHSIIPTPSITHSIKKDKNEDRKKKNREYAQKQRDQYKLYVQKLEQENQQLKVEIENKNKYIQELEQRLNIQQTQKIQKITTITKNDIAKYGIFSLLAIVTILQIDLSDKQFLNIQFGDVVFFNCTAPHSTCRHLIDTYTDLNDQVYKVQEIMPLIKEYGIDTFKETIPFNIPSQNIGNQVIFLGYDQIGDDGYFKIVKCQVLEINIQKLLL